MGKNAEPSRLPVPEAMPTAWKTWGSASAAATASAAVMDLLLRAFVCKAMDDILYFSFTYLPNSAVAICIFSRIGTPNGQRFSHWPQPVQRPAVLGSTA